MIHRISPMPKLMSMIAQHHDAPPQGRIAMRRTTTLVAAAAAIAFIGGLGYAATDEPVIAVAKRLSHDWVDAYNKRDTATLASLYFNDAVVTPDGQPDIQKLFDEKMKQTALNNLKVERSDLTEVRTQVVIGRGSWTGNAQKGGQAAPVTGSYIAIAAKGPDGQWKFLAVDWNLDPLPPVAPAGREAMPSVGTSTPDK
jgi:ketosteroid isomerase-like protein